MTAAREDLGCAAVLVSVYVSTTILDIIPPGYPAKAGSAFYLVSRNWGEGGGGQDMGGGVACSKKSRSRMMYMSSLKIYKKPRSTEKKVTWRGGVTPPIFPTLLYSCAGIFEQSIGARNRVGIGLSYRSARLHRLAQSILWNQFPGSIKV